MFPATPTDGGFPRPTGRSSEIYGLTFHVLFVVPRGRSAQRERRTQGMKKRLIAIALAVCTLLLFPASVSAAGTGSGAVIR